MSGLDPDLPSPTKSTITTSRTLTSLPLNDAYSNLSPSLTHLLCTQQYTYKHTYIFIHIHICRYLTYHTQQSSQSPGSSPRWLKEPRLHNNHDMYHLSSPYSHSAPGILSQYVSHVAGTSWSPGNIGTHQTKPKPRALALSGQSHATDRIPRGPCTYCLIWQLECMSHPHHSKTNTSTHIYALAKSAGLEGRMISITHFQPHHHHQPAGSSFSALSSSHACSPLISM